MVALAVDTQSKSVGELVGERIKALRERRGYSQLELSQMVGVNPVWISKVETRSKYLPEPQVLRKLAAVLGVPIEELLVVAGYLDQDPMWTDVDPRCLAAYRSVPKDKREQFLRLMLALADAVK